MSGARAFAAALLEADAPAPAGLVTWNGSDPAQRFGVYRNNVVVSLIEALRAKFPVVATLVGEDFFRAMARDFARAHPPRSPIMALFGEDFPAFVAGFAPAAQLTYLADVARLEAARLAAYHAADAEALAADAFALVAPDRLAGLRVVFHPAARVLDFVHAAVSIWAAHQGQGDLAAVDPFEPEQALLTRPALEVETRRLAPGEAAMFAALSAGATLGDAAAKAFAARPDFDLTRALATLVASGAAVALEFEGDAS